MTIFIWKNKQETGEIEAHSITHAHQELAALSITYTSLRRKWFSSNKIAKRDIQLFFERFSFLLHAHIPILTILKTLQSDIKNPAFFRLLLSIQQVIKEGRTLYDALMPYPEHFNVFTCELIQLGETSGRLDQALSELVAQQKRMTTIKKSILKALFYPAFLILIAVVITLGLLIFVVPEFTRFYESMGASLPEMTRMLLLFSVFLQKQGFLTLNLLILFFSIVLLRLKYSAFFQNKIASWSLHLPLLGSLLQMTLLLRALRALSLLLSSGTPMMSALNIVMRTTHHPTYYHLFEEVKEKLHQGFSLSSTLSNNIYIPMVIIELIKVGEETGDLSSMLSYATELYEGLLYEKINYLQTFIEPLLILFLSLIICFILLALYLPIFNMGNVI